MQAVKIRGENVHYAKPQGWDEAKFGPCGTLSVRRNDEVHGPSFRSNWAPSGDELARLNAGDVVELECCYVQPAVSVGVVPCDDLSAANARTPVLAAIRGAVARGWCADANRAKELDSDLAEAISQEIAKLLGVVQ